MMWKCGFSGKRRETLQPLADSGKLVEHDRRDAQKYQSNQNVGEYPGAFRAFLICDNSLDGFGLTIESFQLELQGICYHQRLNGKHSGHDTELEQADQSHENRAGLESCNTGIQVGWFHEGHFRCIDQGSLI